MWARAALCAILPIHKSVCDKVEAWLTKSGWTVEGITESPITGPRAMSNS